MSKAGMVCEGGEREVEVQKKERSEESEREREREWKETLQRAIKGSMQSEGGEGTRK